MESSDNRRVVIIDYNPLVHKYLNGGAPPLSHTLLVEGKPVKIDTTIQNYTIKEIHRWANHGTNPTAVCFDSSCNSRKFYFAKNMVTKDENKPLEYKVGRDSLSNRAFDAMKMTLGLLHKGGVSVYKLDNFESDDLVKACVDNAKKEYPNLPIDIVCNDADFLPLVDDQVSVFFRTKKQSWATDKSLLRKGYIQVIPSNFQEVCEGISQYKNISVPYNSILLAKLLRGDKSDGIPGKKDWKPLLYKKLIALLEDDAVALDSIFRYGDEEQLDLIVSTLGEYIDTDDIEHIKNVYRGINLNGAFEGFEGKFSRKPAVITTPITGYNPLQLQKEVSKLNINLTI